ncbi:hypothetical protein CTAYLR_008057 [Chrysophaeum taylorii]|uniref:Long-chain-alcohol oxidase n=1 Tax=Chrysophaeum taylorii TaxID=2483200 RepID=A0AAD7UJL7_9STRA|nr:hypothetical protein CTAYLR_008057 [Chrysophaeum taylorii]
MVGVINGRSRETLYALLETLVPSLDEKTARAIAGESASEAVVASLMQSGRQAEAVAAIERALEVLLAHEARDFRVALWLLGTRLGTLALTGCLPPFGGFGAWEVGERETALLSMARSGVGQRRKAFNALKRLLLAVIISSTGEDGTNPHWAAAGFSLPKALFRPPPKSADYEWPTVENEKSVTCDVAIVGSGCGAGVCAARLAAAGFDVVVLEKGEIVAADELGGDEASAFARLYERAGLVTTSCGSMSILAGATFGGGSTVNWSCSLRTPPIVQNEWGFPFCGERFEAALDEVSRRLGVQERDVVHNRPNAILFKGCEVLGVDVATAPQNLEKTDGPEPWLIPYGDRFGLKRSTPRTYLRDAAKTGNCRVISRCEVRRVLRDAAGRAAALECLDGRKVLARRAVVLAAGSLNTPAILLRSGVPNPNIGRSLRLHPVTPVVGVFEPPPNEMFAIGDGAPMTVVSRAQAFKEDDPYGALIEVPHGPLALSIACKPWTGGLALKKDLLLAKRLSPLVVLQRDSGDGGTVRLDADGLPVVDYKINDHDRRSMTTALVQAAKILAAAGARRILTYHLADPVDVPARRTEDHHIEAEIRRRGVASRPNDITLLSAHQMGTCKMGTDPATSVVDQRAQSWELPGCYVCDASLFPTASGVNPMLTTMALATIVSDDLAETLSKQSDQDDDSRRALRWIRARRRLRLRRAAVLAAVKSETLMPVDPGASDALVRFDVPEARCLDGSAFAYYMSTPKPKVTDYAIYLHGGGLCLEPIDCAERAKGDEGSSNNWTDALAAGDNVLSIDGPFANWNRVLLRYCSGDTWTGTDRETAKSRFGLFFAGHQMINATIDRLRRQYNMSRVLVAGGSAGGVGVNVNCDFIASKLEGAQVWCSPQSGLFFPDDVYARWQQILNFPEVPKEPASVVASEYVTRYFDSFVDESCARALGDDWRLCWTANVALKYVETPVFLAQNAWDEWQLDYVLCPRLDLGDDCPDDYLASYKNKTLVTIYRLATASFSASFGAWIPSCYAHTADTCLVPAKRSPPRPTLVQGNSYSDVLVDWMTSSNHNNNPSNPWLLIDDCVSQNDATPCNPDCAGC